MRLQTIFGKDMKANLVSVEERNSMSMDSVGNTILIHHKENK